VEPAGRLPDGAEYVPKCTWIDADHTNGIPDAALKFDTAAYGEQVEDTVNNNRGCAFTIYGADNGPIAGMWSRFLYDLGDKVLLMGKYRTTWCEESS